jgi:hypothetical protein
MIYSLVSDEELEDHVDEISKVSDKKADSSRKRKKANSIEQIEGRQSDNLSDKVS